jgi:hypothetical protein
MVWAAFWAIFSQTHLVTLMPYPQLIFFKPSAPIGSIAATSDQSPLTLKD